MWLKPAPCTSSGSSLSALSRASSPATCSPGPTTPRALFSRRCLGSLGPSWRLTWASGWAGIVWIRSGFHWRDRGRCGHAFPVAPPGRDPTGERSDDARPIGSAPLVLGPPYRVISVRLRIDRGANKLAGASGSPYETPANATRQRRPSPPQAADHLTPYQIYAEGSQVE